jgi:patatin-like phospholipase/acyl hydrolase
MLFGVFANHSPESCPLNNKESKRIFLAIEGKIKANQKKFNISQVVGFYMSVLEHQWIIILDAKNAHDIEQFCIAAGISAISTIKIIPVNDFAAVSKKFRKSSGK